MQLLDREGELETLFQALAQAAKGQGSVVLVTGEAGIGKTSLLRAFIAGVDEAVRVLRGACEDLSVAEPLGPLRDLLRKAEPQLSGQLEETVSLISTYSDILAACAEHPGGTVVVIEDLHWADDATVDFVRFVARRIVDHPICLVVSARAERTENRQIIRRAFGDLSAETLQRIALAPLSQIAVAELCRGGARDPATIYSASGGNAFYVTELLQNQGEDLPLSIRDAVLARADRLGPEARSVLEAVSTIPRRAEIEHIEAILDDDLDLAQAVEDCLDAGLLQTDGENLAFQHEIAREAVASSLSQLKLRALHRRLYGRLSNSGDVGLSRLLHHAQGAGDNNVVVNLAPRAAKAAAGIGSRREAAAFYVLAVEAGGKECDADLLEAAAACYLGGNHSYAAGYQSRALELIEGEKDPLRRGDGLRKLSRYRWVRSDFSGAFEAIHRAIEVLANRRGPELAQAYSSLSQLLMTSHRMDEVEVPATKAIELAREFDRQDIISHALNNFGMSNSYSDPQKARALMAESIEIGQTLDDPDHTARAMSNWMHLEFENCEFEGALERAEISAVFNLKEEMDAYYRYALGMNARANLELGNWNYVVETALRGFDPDDRVPESYHFNSALALLVHQVRTGGPRDTNVEEYLALFDHEASEVQRIGPYADIIAERAWLEGNGLEPAVARLAAVAENASFKPVTGSLRVWLQRFGVETPEVDLTLFAEPYRLELLGDRAGAVHAWDERKAPYQKALTLAFGAPKQQAEALGMFESLNATPAIQRMREILCATDTPRRGRPAADGPYGLTGRQLDVLRLLDEGLTNAQIGESLFISPKTVDHHVSAILARLEASSRGEAAAKARKLNLI